MRLAWVTNPSSGKPDPMLTLSVLVVTCACIKFLLEGVSVVVSGHNVDFGHVDATVYGALLTPVLAVHGFIKGKRLQNQSRLRPDNPDQESNDE